MSISKTAYYYEPKKKAGDEDIKIRLLEYTQQHKPWGFDKIMMKLKLENYSRNHKRRYRIYCELGLHIRVKLRKRIPAGEAKIIAQQLAQNRCWAMDFISDALAYGRCFRTLNAIDDYHREALLVNASFSLTSHNVTRLLEQIAAMKGYPVMKEVNELACEWMTMYNQERPHQSLAELTPHEFSRRRNHKDKIMTINNSTFE